MFLSGIGSGIVAFLLWGLASSATQLYFFAVIFGALVSLSFPPPPLAPAANSLLFTTTTTTPPPEWWLPGDLDQRRVRLCARPAGALGHRPVRHVCLQGHFCRRRPYYLGSAASAQPRDVHWGWGLRSAGVRVGGDLRRIVRDCHRGWECVGRGYEPESAVCHVRIC